MRSINSRFTYLLTYLLTSTLFQVNAASSSSFDNHCIYFIYLTRSQHSYRTYTVSSVGFIVARYRWVCTPASFVISCS